MPVQSLWGLWVTQCRRHTFSSGTLAFPCQYNSTGAPGSLVCHQHYTGPNLSIGQRL